MHVLALKQKLDAFREVNGGNGEWVRGRVPATHCVSGGDPQCPPYLQTLVPGYATGSHSCLGIDTEIYKVHMVYAAFHLYSRR